jgi:hypothetical protein
VSARQQDSKLEVKEAAEHRRDSGVAPLLAIEEKELDARAWSREKASDTASRRACSARRGEQELEVELVMLLRLQMMMSIFCVRGDEHMEVQVLGLLVSAVSPRPM